MNDPDASTVVPTISAHIVVRGAARAAGWHADVFGAREEELISRP